MFGGFTFEFVIVFCGGAVGRAICHYTIGHGGRWLKLHRRKFRRNRNNGPADRRNQFDSQPLRYPRRILAIGLRPTAAGVNISGRVLRSDGVAIGKAFVTITDGSGQTWIALSSPMGHYRFEDIPSGETYIVSVSSKTHQFVPRVVTVLDELTDLDLIALE